METRNERVITARIEGIAYSGSTSYGYKEDHTNTFVHRASSPRVYERTSSPRSIPRRTDKLRNCLQL